MRLPFKNHTVFAGYVGNDAPLRYLPSGEATVSARIIAKVPYRDEAGGYKTLDEWATAVFYRKLAEEFAASGISKGAFVHVEGRRHTREWTDGRGYKKTAHEIIVSDWHQVVIAHGSTDAEAAPKAERPKPAVKPPKDTATPSTSPARKLGELA